MCLLVSVSCVKVPPESEPAKATSEEASFAVHIRLTDLAQTAEAKEFMGLYFLDHLSRHTYSAEDKAWLVTYSVGGEGMRGMREADWYEVADEDRFHDVVSGGVKYATWVVFDDGRILPQGLGLIVESYIERLNTDKVLR